MNRKMKKAGIATILWVLLNLLYLVAGVLVHPVFFVVFAASILSSVIVRYALLRITHAALERMNGRLGAFQDELSKMDGEYNDR